MKNLSLEQMAVVEGGDQAAIICGIGIGLAIGTGGNPFAIGFALAVCLSGDTPQ